MKTALYLGSFNPFHKGHLSVIKSALNDFKMDRVIIVPAMQNPWKKEKALTFPKRISIILASLLYENIENVYIDDIEKSLISPYYSYATLHALKNKYCNDEVFVLCGTDTIKAIPNWMNGEAIIRDYNFLVVDRPKNSISSSHIREIVRSNRNSDDALKELVSENVIDLIKKYYK